MKTVVSWSGGKDGCLTLQRLQAAGHEVVGLLSMVSEQNGRNRAHGIPLPWLKLQAEALGLPLTLVDSEPAYGQALAGALDRLRREQGVAAVAFGTLYAERDRGWNEGIAAAAGLEPLFPLWTTADRASCLLHQWIASGYEAVVCRAAQDRLDRSWVGRKLDQDFFAAIHALPVCPMGENGEYHTIVLDGPLFAKRVELVRCEVVPNAGLWSLDVQECCLLPK